LSAQGNPAKFEAAGPGSSKKGGGGGRRQAGICAVIGDSTICGRDMWACWEPKQKWCSCKPTPNLKPAAWLLPTDRKADLQRNDRIRKQKLCWEGGASTNIHCLQR